MSASATPNITRPSRAAGLLLATCGILASCHLAPAHESADSPVTLSRIAWSGAELSRVGMETVFDALRLIRPQMLMPRTPRTPTQPVSLVEVYVNYSYVGDVRVLQQFNVAAVREVRYVAPAEAEFRYARIHPAGILEVVLLPTHPDR